MQATTPKPAATKSSGQSEKQNATQPVVHLTTITELPSSPNRGRSSSTVTASELLHTTQPLFGLPAPFYYINSFTHAGIAGPVATGLLKLFNDMHSTMVGVIKNFQDVYKKAGGQVEGNDEQIIKSLDEHCKMLRYKIDKETKTLSIDLYNEYVKKFNMLHSMNNKTTWGGLGTVVHTNFANNVKDDFLKLSTLQKNYEEECKKIQTEQMQKQMEEDFRIKAEEDKKRADEQAKLKAEEEERRKKEDARREEELKLKAEELKLLKETLEEQRRQRLDDEKRRREEDERRKKDDARRDEELKQLRLQTQTMQLEYERSIIEKDATIRRLEEQVSLLSQVGPKPSAPKGSIVGNGIDIDAARRKLEESIGKKHAELVRELTKLRSNDKLKPVVEKMIVHLILEIESSVNEQFFEELNRIQLDPKDAHNALMDEFRGNYKKYVDAEGEQEKTIGSILSASAIKIKATPGLKAGTTPLSNYYSKLAEIIDKLFSTSIPGLKHDDLKQKAEQLRTQEVQRLEAEKSAAATTSTLTNGGKHS